MNHPFLSLLPSLREKRRLLQLNRDAVTIMALPNDSMELVRSHCGALLKTEQERDTYARIAPRLGVLMDDLGIDDGGVEAWKLFLRGQPMGAAGAAVLSTLHANITSLQAEISRMEELEHDSGSSSYSDMSDSEDDTSSDEESSEDESTAS